jgi:hypothetical protein
VIQMPVTKSFLLGAATVATSVTLLVPAGASAAPSTALARLLPEDSSGKYKDLTVRLEASSFDKTPQAVSVRYEDGAFVFTDTAGVVPLSGMSGEGNTCAAAGPSAVSCAIDLSDPAIAVVEFRVATGAGDDRIDLRDMPDLPGLELTGSTEGRTRGPARPDFSAGAGNDVVLTGAFDADGDLGNGADLLRGGSGKDGQPFVTQPGGGIHGGRGPDRMIGGPGDDWLAGDLGDDFLKGDAGGDILIGGLGNDRLHSRDGQVDLVSCGPGKRSRQPIRRDRIDKRLRHAGKPAHYGCMPTP